GDHAFPGAVRNDGRGILRLAQINHYALKTRGSFGFRHAAQRFQKFFDIRAIGRVFPRVACRVHARRAVERIDLEAGVIRNGGIAGVLRGMTRLKDGVLHERQTGLLGSGNAEVRLGRYRETELREHLVYLANLARIAAREDDRSAHPPASARRWLPISCSIPRRASSVMRLSCSCVNVPRSAVPWTSMKARVSFITKFISVSAVESSA